MSFKEAEQGDQQGRVCGPFPKLLSPDSGQVEEAPGPPRFTERFGQCSQAECNRVIRRGFWRFCVQGLGYRGKRSRGLARILIVEDNALNIKLFCDLLEAHGHATEAVTDSRQALQAAQDFAPDLVITDIQLPHVSGLELIRMIRADERLAEVPIMAVTAYATSGDEDRARDIGAQAYVAKPISVARFVQTVDELLESAASTAQ